MTEAKAMSYGATLNANDLQAAEAAAKDADAAVQAGRKSAVVPLRDYQSGAVVRKALATQVPVYRFYNRFAASHFYTVSEAERAAIIANPALAHLMFEGPAFYASSAPASGFTPVYRFLNGQTGVHFYTVSLSERDAIIANPALKHYAYEGIAYYAGLVQGDGLMPLYRFFVPSKGFHFYTASASERNSIRNSMGETYVYEGVASYVVASAVLGETLPHTGSPRSRCVSGTSGYVVNPVPCDSAEALALNPQQDGHRSGINPMSYSALPGYPLTSCVKDNVTGLIWEGKEATGERAWYNQYSHFRDGRVGEANAYVDKMNAMRLCGYNDWRLPTIFELFTLVNYSRGSYLDEYQPNQDPAWFPNSGAAGAGMSFGVLAGDAMSAPHKVAWLEFRTKRSQIADLNLNPYSKFNVRLVRGGVPSQPRFSYATVAYAADAANNVAVDAWTGLQWRRCLVGQTWNGSTCTGTASENLNFYQTLSLARQATGWRLPNAREMASLLDLSQDPGPMMDPVVFPGPLDSPIGGVGQFATSTLEYGFGSWLVTFVGGTNVSAGPESFVFVIRLVRSP